MTLTNPMDITRDERGTWRHICRSAVNACVIIDPRGAEQTDGHATRVADVVIS